MCYALKTRLSKALVVNEVPTKTKDSLKLPYNVPRILFQISRGHNSLSFVLVGYSLRQALLSLFSSNKQSVFSEDKNYQNVTLLCSSLKTDCFTREPLNRYIKHKTPITLETTNPIAIYTIISRVISI
jgi:hypothetical protein